MSINVKDIKNSDVLKEELNRIFKKKIDWTTKGNQDYLELLTGQILMLVPEAASFLAKNGLEDKNEVIYGSMIAIGITLKIMGEKHLGKESGTRDESLH